MFRREPREPIERPLSQFRQHLEQSAVEEDLLPEDEETTPVGSEVPPTAYQRTTPWQHAEAPSRSTLAPQSDRALSVVAANATWEGTLQTDGSLLIHGRVKGTIRATQDVHIAEGASVEAQVTAQNIVVYGTVRGRLEAAGRLEIQSTGQVIGEVCAPTLVVHEGARLSGKLEMSSSEAKGR